MPFAPVQTSGPLCTFAQIVLPPDTVPFSAVTVKLEFGTVAPSTEKIPDVALQGMITTRLSSFTSKVTPGIAVPLFS